MKKTYALSTLIMVLFIIGCGDDDEYGVPIDLPSCTGEIITETERINQEQLTIADIPMDIRNYVATDLAGFGLVSGLLYQNQNNEVFYLMQLENNAQLLFDQSLMFICAEGDFQTGEYDDISYDQLPQIIKDYLHANYPGVGLEQAEFEDGEYEIELENGVELCFDQLGNFIGKC